MRAHQIGAPHAMRAGQRGYGAPNVTATCGLHESVRRIVAYTPGLWWRFFWVAAGVGTFGFGCADGNCACGPTDGARSPEPSSLHGEGCW
jgi:hypothetical protein